MMRTLIELRRLAPHEGDERLRHVLARVSSSVLRDAGRWPQTGLVFNQDSYGGRLMMRRGVDPHAGCLIV